MIVEPVEHSFGRSFLLTLNGLITYMARHEHLEGSNVGKKAHLQKSYTPTGSPDTITKNTYYLESVDDMFRRKYLIKA